MIADTTSFPFDGADMHGLMQRLFPICRSLTGEGVRESFQILGALAPIELHEVASGTKCFDWTVPDEWNIRDAYVKDAAGNRLVDFQKNNLHVVGYSEPVEATLSRTELEPHLHTREDLPDAIPYVTSYYKRQWGFCLAHNDMGALGDGPFEVKIDSTLAPGSMTYGELLIPGREESEILLSTNICHPSMANNELSGPVMLIALAKWLMDQPSRRYSYRLLWLPETIGAIAYISRHLETLRERTVAGYQVVCVGGPDTLTYLRSRNGNSLADRMAIHALKSGPEDYRVLDFTHRASDERQWCSPGVDLPVGSLMRSKYHDYAAYHTSLDDLEFVGANQLQSTLAAYARILAGLEQNLEYVLTSEGCEPHLSAHDLYPTTGGQSHRSVDTNHLLAILAYADGHHDLLKISELHGLAISDLFEPAKVLLDAGLIKHPDTLN